jgi:hypothetical protein
MKLFLMDEVDDAVIEADEACGIEVDFVEANGANEIVVEAPKSMTVLKQTMSMMISLKQMKLTS